MLLTKNQLVLENERVRLISLDSSHFAELLPLVNEDKIWRWSGSNAGNEHELRNYIEIALEERQAGIRLPFVIFDKDKNTICGSTSYGAISNRHLRVEIGWTWLGVEHQRTGLNRNAKFVLLSHAFENLKFERVEFKKDLNNTPSRNALKAIGAFEEGVLRSHITNWQGNRRDTIYYSILISEWERIKNSIFASCSPFSFTTTHE
jgi:N-acetyltransferase